MSSAVHLQSYLSKWFFLECHSHKYLKFICEVDKMSLFIAPISIDYAVCRNVEL